MNYLFITKDKYKDKNKKIKISKFDKLGILNILLIFITYFSSTETTLYS